MRLHYLFSIFVFLISFQSWAHISHRPDGHAPIGVMADHGHKKGEVMMSFRSMIMQMDGLIAGTRDTSSGPVFDSTPFMMAPEKMEMWMHMLGAMYGITDRWTLMLMLPYVSNDMTMARKMQGDELETSSSGIGDIPVTGLYSIVESDDQRLLVSMTAFVPTGSIEKDRNGVRLAYPMQLGAGSFALLPKLTFSQYWNSFSMGTQAGVKTFIDENSAGYKRGNQYSVDIWGAYNICESLSSSLRLFYQATDPLENSDNQIMPMMSPTNRPDFQHGEIGLVHWGVNFLGRESIEGHRLALEFGLPVYQNSNGIQMKSKMSATLGWQKLF